MTQFIQIAALVPIVIVSVILFGHWIVLGFTICNSLIDWVFYICISIVVVGIIKKTLLNFWLWLFHVKEIYIPPLSEPIPEKQTESTPTSNNYPQVIEEGRGFDFGKYKQGSPEAANAYKQSSEFKENSEKLRTLDQLIKDARKEINESLSNA